MSNPKTRRGRSKPTEDDLSIPDFLLVRNRPKSATRAAATAETGDESPPPPAPEPWRKALDGVQPPEFREFLETCIRRGRFERRWLDIGYMKFQKCVDEQLAAFRVQYDESLEKAERRREQLAKLRENRPRKVNPLAGLVPLRAILEELGDKAPKRRHAMTAIEEAKLAHTKFHFPNSPVTLAHVRQVILKYRPPERTRGERPAYSPEATILFEGDNPKRAGSPAHARWELLRSHHKKTVGQFLAADGNPITLRNAIEQGRAKLK